MMNEQNDREKIQSIYYNLLTTLSPNSRKVFYSQLGEGIKGLLDSVFAEIYMFDFWNKRFELVSIEDSLYLNKYIEDSNYFYRDIIIDGVSAPAFPVDDIFTRDLPEISYKIVALHPEIGPVGFIILGERIENTVSDSALLQLKEETEKLLSHIYRLAHAKSNEEKNRFLFETTSQFFTLTNKTDIFTEIITSIRKFYPNLDYYLLLSQDHDKTSSLPIKALKFSDDATKHVSEQAFINGELQIEDRIQEKSTCIYAPLKGYQGVYGVLQIISPTIIEIPEYEIEFITNFGNAAGKAIENVTLYQSSKHLVSDLQLINNITHELNSNLNVNEITNLVKEQIIRSSLAQEVGFIYKTQELAHKFEVLEGSTSYFNTVQGRGFIRYLAEDMISRKEGIFSGDYKNPDLQIPYRSVMVLPMENSGEINGFVVVLHEKSYAFSFDKYKLLQLLVRPSTLAFVNTILKEQLQKAASTDYLTQLYSRNYMDEKIVQHMESGEMGTLILFDIDDFKKINDTHGHYVGDEVIKQVADIIMSSIDERDVPARWGGEELAIYLPNTLINEGLQLAKNIGNQVENFTEPRVTLSAGVSSWSGKSEDSARDFFIRADKALYEAKSFGKNCVVKCEELKHEKGD
ncbi:sensor domain-containing diguanylate cyclase [Ornithinibacillus xuwenensis]|uniref:GGDEF domain-containing protein n=1 Tax=Ornithinibacillus xuwenensis TaxID=3144668 RepID=A0ABU9XPX6_9BACI